MKSLKNRLILSYFGLTVITLLLLGGLFFFMVARYSEQAEIALSEQARQRSINQIYNFMNENPDLGELEVFIESIERSQGVEILLFDEFGEDVFEHYTPNALFSIDADVRMPQILNMNQMGMGRKNQPEAPGIQWQFFLGKNGAAARPQDIMEILEDGFLDFSIAGVPQTGELIVEAPEAPVNSYINPIGLVFLLASLVVLIISAIIGWRIGDSLTKPLRALTGVVYQMAEGDLNVRAEDSSRDIEISILASRINTMAEELQGTISSLQEERDIMQRFLMDASHELRTPVTALTAYLELLEGKAGDDPKRREEYIAMCISQNDRSRDIIVNLLDLLRIEQYGSAENSNDTDIDVGGLMDQVISMVAPLAEAKGLGLVSRSDETEPVNVYGDSFQLTTALKNVIENSIKYSPEKTLITVKRRVKDGKVRITIFDEGPGIPEEDLHRIYDRFFRSTKATGTGSGLGLSMVKRIIENHDGTIEISNREDIQGLGVVISLPVR